jgi:hypothetical protein
MPQWRQMSSASGSPAKASDAWTMLGGQLVKISPTVKAGDAVDDMGVRTFGQRLGHFGHELPVGRLVEFGEAGGDAGLERIVAEKRGAEGVDRLDLEATGRLDGGGEEGAGLLVPDRALDAEGAEFGLEPRVLQHRPFAEAGEEAVLHLSRRRLGIREAEDAARIGIGKQKPRHAVGEHTGLAGARIGRQPGGPPRVGGGDLGEGRIVERGHGTSSGLGSVPSSHSP